MSDFTSTHDAHQEFRSRGDSTASPHKVERDSKRILRHFYQDGTKGESKKHSSWEDNKKYKSRKDEGIYSEKGKYRG
ncbi:hypothetical protein IMSHALPRED_011138 [Imshaugia aleurites]|uniref:Uncharacterized protein n=1 Tax=Imshaugia aleurites TaxID=172621 RepID=A0A8H3G635_9LECA|nr:hypothetical protein IMSHALPRED_011138 [Imshaugia aleurites]